MRSIAREQAESVYRAAVAGLFGLIERRIEWRRANAHVLALEAERMIWLLRDRTTYPRVAFRRIKIRVWQYRYRKHAARAHANSKALAQACSLCPKGGA